MKKLYEEIVELGKLVMTKSLQSCQERLLEITYIESDYMDCTGEYIRDNGRISSPKELVDKINFIRVKFRDFGDELRGMVRYGGSHWVNDMYFRLVVAEGYWEEFLEENKL